MAGGKGHRLGAQVRSAEPAQRAAYQGSPPPRTGTLVASLDHLVGTREQAVGMLVARPANGPREGQDLAGVVAAPAVLRERDRGGEREQRQQGRRRERGSHRSPPGASRPTEVNCPSPRGVKTPSSPSAIRSPVAS